jgi:antirestriction protein ArdC
MVTCHARCHPLQPQILDRFAVCPFSESVAIWFPCLVEGTNSQLNERTKKMNSENIKKVTNQAIEQLITALNGGRSETLTQYLAAIGRFHRYSVRNVMLIASQKPTATHIAGFHAWHKLGRFVKKGEKGILILAPIARRKNESEEQTETDESSTAVGFRATYVFDISQTDGQELPTIGSVNGEPREYRECLAKFVTGQGITLEYSKDIAPARGTSAGGKITLLPGQSPAEEFATLAHELAHEMMHRDERRSSTSKRSRETEAEAVAFVVCHAIGLETGSASQDYIQLYEGDAKLLTASLAYIQKTATHILNAIGAEVPSPPIA